MIADLCQSHVELLDFGVLYVPEEHLLSICNQEGLQGKVEIHRDVHEESGIVLLVSGLLILDLITLITHVLYQLRHNSRRPSNKICFPTQQPITFSNIHCTGELVAIVNS